MNLSIYLYIVAYALLGWFLYSRLAPVKGLRYLDAKEFRKQLEQSPQAVIIDVRQPHEYQSGHIPNAANIPLSRLKSRIGHISKDQPIFLYCQSGIRSRQAARILSKKGFTNLSHLHGGILSWEGEIVR